MSGTQGALSWGVNVTYYPLKHVRLSSRLGGPLFFRTCSQVFSISLVSPLFRLILCMIFLSSVSLVFIVRSPTIAYVSAGTRVRRVTWV